MHIDLCSMFSQKTDQSQFPDNIYNVLKHRKQKVSMFLVHLGVIYILHIHLQYYKMGAYKDLWITKYVILYLIYYIVTYMGGPAKVLQLITIVIINKYYNMGGGVHNCI